MHSLLEHPGALATLRETAAMLYIGNHDVRAHQMARWSLAASDYAPVDGGFLQKTAFRGRDFGLLAAERDRLSHKLDRQAKDPAVDSRMRELRAQLHRLNTLHEALKGSIPKEGDEFERLLVKFCGPGGWRHNMPLLDGRGTFDTGHIKRNSPVTASDHNIFQMELLRPWLPAFDNRTVFDIGPADGYFGLTAAREGAQVYMVEPDPLFCLRTKFFARYYGVEDKIHLVNNYLVERHAAILNKADVCIALGLLYYLWPLRSSLDLLLQTRCNLVLEYDFESRDLHSPEEAESGWLAGSPIPDVWLLRYLGQRGWTVHELPEWEQRMTSERPTAPARKMIVCRRHTFVR